MDREIPLGLGLALSDNAAALSAFAGLSHNQRRQIVRQAGAVESRYELEAMLRALTMGSGPDLPPPGGLM